MDLLNDALDGIDDEKPQKPPVIAVSEGLTDGDSPLRDTKTCQTKNSSTGIIQLVPAQIKHYYDPHEPHSAQIQSLPAIKKFQSSNDDQSPDLHLRNF